MLKYVNHTRFSTISTFTIISPSFRLCRGHETCRNACVVGDHISSQVLLVPSHGYPLEGEKPVETQVAGV